MSKRFPVAWCYDRRGTRYPPCSACGGGIEKFMTYAETNDGEIRVCPTCIAYQVRTLDHVGKIPTVEEYLDADSLLEAAEIQRFDGLSPAEAAAEVVKRGHLASMKQWFFDKAAPVQQS